jgi:hypothetical protein
MMVNEKLTGNLEKGTKMDNYQYSELKDAIKRIDELENQIGTLKQLILNSTCSSGHFSLNAIDENFLYTKVGDK